MSDSLSNAQIIGGVAVVIGADTSKLRAGYAEAKMVAGQIDRIAPTVRIGMTVDGSKVAAAVRTAVAQAQAIAQNVRLEMPLRLDMRPAQAQIEDMRRQIASVAAQATSGGQSRLNGPGGGGWQWGGGGRGGRGGGPAAWGNGPDDVDAEGQGPLPGPGGGGAGGSGGGGGGGGSGGGAGGPGFFRRGLNAVNKLGDMNSRSFNTLLRLGVAGRIVGAGANYLANATDPEIGPRVAFGDTLKGLDNFAGGPGQSLLRAQRNIANTNPDLDQALKIATSGLWGSGDRIVAATNRLGLTNTMTAEDERQFAAQQDFAARHLDTVQKQWNYKHDKQILAADDTYQGTLAAVDNRVLVSTASRQLAVSSGTITSGVAGRQEINQGTDAKLQQLNAELADLKAKNSPENAQRQIDIAKTIEAITKAGDDALASYDADLKRQGQEIVAGATSSIRQSTFRIARNPRGEEAEKINETYRPRLAEIEKSFGKNSAEYRTTLNARNAELGNSSFAFNHDDTLQIVSENSLAEASRLRISKQTQKAELTDFDRQAAEQIQALRDAGHPDPDDPVVTSLKKRLGAQKGEIITRQSDDNTAFATRLGTRQEIARASGSGNEKLAAEIGRIASLDEEMVAARPDQKVALARTQIVELQADRQRIVSSNRYGEQHDHTTFAPGGPGGDAAAKQLTYLDTIAKAILKLNDIVAGKPTGLVN